ncbi:helix-turn-helix domain-containing protein [Fibrella aquatilis]|uniref:Helix-turn-helix domain-containing protein n=1 Tax=Fibrella aquatilis TaxID=2817059 RepID=A0A939G521_9BACT|nr:helix-turn-helix domain-containing protein [Fibrella aquatilis]MBO0930570.1 helix-turn-helix domain-containing protein [Fibrella aquatilis]
MQKKPKSIPINTIADEVNTGIAIEKIAITDLPEEHILDAKRSHREDRHTFFLLEKGVVAIEIDCQKQLIRSPAVVYIHPNQVHRILSFEQVLVSSWAIDNEQLNPAYLTWLEAITPVKPLPLNKETFSLISEAVSLSIKLFKLKNDRLYHSLIKDSCNALVGLVISNYVAHAGAIDKLSRSDTITKLFRATLDRHFATSKKPADYAQRLNISTPYLNECVKSTTGHSVSYHIQQRIMLEAKRLLSHTDKSVKEIALELGYEDYPYFSRLFGKVTGIAPLTFRNKNCD